MKGSLNCSHRLLPLLPMLAWHKNKKGKGKDQNVDERSETTIVVVVHVKKWHQMELDSKDRFLKDHHMHTH